MKVVLKYVTVLFLVVFASSALAEVRIATWNVKRMNSENKNMDALVQISSYFDLIALQEVMEEEAVLSLVNTLQNSTNSEWGMMVSHPIGRGSYKEMYAFVWRKSHINYVDAAVVYLDDADVFAREPLSARFQTKAGNTFIASNIHVLYGESKKDREPEIQALRRYWDWLAQTFPEEQYFLMGDFNMHPNDASFGPLLQVASPVVTEGATTLSPTDDRYANLYDNIWVPNNIKGNFKAGILEFPNILKWTHSYARDVLSDHAPVFLTIYSFDEESGLYSASPFGEGDEIVERTTLLVRANKNSLIFHLPECPNYDDMLNSPNLVEFSTPEEALENGFRVAQNCS